MTSALFQIEHAETQSWHLDAVPSWGSPFYSVSADNPRAEYGQDLLRRLIDAEVGGFGHIALISLTTPILAQIQRDEMRVGFIYIRLKKARNNAFKTKLKVM